MPTSGRFVVSRFALSAALAALLGATACSERDHGPGADHDHGSESHDHAEAAEGPEPWAVTAWGDRYEIFPEVDPLVAGRAAESHTHVTTLADFSPLTEGSRGNPFQNIRVNPLRFRCRNNMDYCRSNLRRRDEGGAMDSHGDARSRPPLRRD